MEQAAQNPAWRRRIDGQAKSRIVRDFQYPQWEGENDGNMAKSRQER